jgi:hypothetical protein
VIEVAKLKSRTVKDLAAMAKRRGVAGWHSMRKEDLVKALAKCAKSEARRKIELPGEERNGRSNGAGNGNGHHALDRLKAKSKAMRRLKEVQKRLTQFKDLSYRRNGLASNGYTKDRVVVMVRDPFWLHVYWELTRNSVERTRVALGERWHGARPVLRMSEITQDGTTSTVRKIVRDIKIHGSVNNWYVDVAQPPRTYQVDIGYLAADGQFSCIARSNVVSTPAVGAASTVDGNWSEVAEDFDRIYALSGGYADHGDHSDLKALFEQRLKRPMGSPMVTRFGLGAAGRGHRDFCLEVDADLMIYGVTAPGSHVTLRGEPVKVEPDGTFSLRLPLTDRRQVLPVVSNSGDGMEQRTIVLAVERNTKIMEPVTREPDA